MAKWQFARPGGPWEYPTYGFTAVDGAILDGALFDPEVTVAPDAFWSAYGGGSAETGVTRWGSVTYANQQSEPADGAALVYNATSNAYEPQAASLSATYASRGKFAKTKAADVETWGHSYGAGIGASDRSKSFSYIVARALGMRDRNEAISGSSVSSAPAGASYVKTLQQITAAGLGAVTGSGTTATGDRGFTAPGGVYLAMYGINDVNELGGLANQLEAVRDTLRTTLSRWHAGAIFEEDDPTFTFNGTWVNSGASTDRNSGAGYKYATSAASSYSITTPADFPGGTVAIGLVSNSPLGGGATHAATVGGVTTTLHAHHRRTGGTGNGHVLRVPNVPAGVQTITVALSNVVTLTGVDYWQWEAAGNDAPLIALIKQPYCPDYTAYGAGGAFGPPTNARVDDLNSIMGDLAAEFAGRVVVVDLAALNGDATMFTSDKLHPNDKGYRRIGEIILAAINAAGWTVVPGGRDAPYETHGTAAATGNRKIWYVGDVVHNSAPAVLGAGGSQYTIHSWVCTVSGAPGTWVERRMPTGT